MIVQAIKSIDLIVCVSMTYLVLCLCLGCVSQHSTLASTDESWRNDQQNAGPNFRRVFVAVAASRRCGLNMGNKSMF